MSQQMATGSATTLDLGVARWARDEDVSNVFDPLYRAALERAPSGRMVARGLPFQLASESSDRRWLLVDRPRRVDLGGVTATHLVVMGFCDAWHDGSGDRPAGVPVGWVVPVGQPLATLRVDRMDGEDRAIVLRRRFEVNDGIVGWGGLAFLAVPHHAEKAVDWRGPHERLPQGRFAAPGHTGPMTVLPASWGSNQTGVEDHVPSPSGDITMWLHAIEVSRGGEPAGLDAIELSPIGATDAPPSVVVAAITAFSGGSSPLRWNPRRSLRLAGATDVAVDVDLGTVARRRPIPRSRVDDHSIAGWGVDAVAASGEEELELTAADDATLEVGGRRVALRDVDQGEVAIDGSGIRIRAMPPAERRVRVEVVDVAGQSTPARTRGVARDGRYLPPLGHRAEINPGLNEDLGADVIINGAEYAYVDGGFEIDLPSDGASLEIVGGFHRAPLQVDVGRQELERGAIRVAFGEPIRPGEGRWVAGDTHVHFLAPSTALLQARAEGVNAVHLLACTWGEHHTSLPDFGADLTSGDGEHAVWVGSENRQNMLGHVGLVGTREPLLPFTSGGPPEGPIGAPVTHLMADWLGRCREGGGLAIGAHFPLPTAEVPADIAWEQFDALEFETFDHTLDNPPIRGWYRFLDAGYRLPVVGGTDKMTASVPLGQIRTWARLDGNGPVTFEAWADAVRAGRTFVSSGPMLELRADGHEPGSTISTDRGATVEVEVHARAAQPVITAVEIVVDSVVVAQQEAEEPTTDLVLRHRLRVDDTGWMAARSRSPFAIGSAFATAMAAHTSPIYIECRERPRRPTDLTEPLAIVDGTRAWLEHLAPIRDPGELARFRRFLDEAERRLRERHG